MRAVLLDALPTLAHFYGLMPWDVDRLTPLELRAMLDALPDRKSQ